MIRNGRARTAPRTVLPGRLVAAVALAGLISAGCAEAAAEIPSAEEGAAADENTADADPDFESAQQMCRHLSPPVEGREGNGG